MGQEHCFHAAGAQTDFLGWRVNRNGNTEIVYDDGRAKRLIWRAEFVGDARDRLDAALSSAVMAGHEKMIPTLFDELKKRAIALAPLVR